ncbi:unnamed protein product [Allacma fusca]|uniref:Uncharacterized protein n=1 Tax=Allacma fusca TaxID=39272 RepID=A0A8J2LD75_9HEXA|nr:unnamed protein product [Allacma fusca]
MKHEINATVPNVHWTYRLNVTMRTKIAPKFGPAWRVARAVEQRGTPREIIINLCPQYGRTPQPLLLQQHEKHDRQLREPQREMGGQQPPHPELQ